MPTITLMPSGINAAFGGGNSSPKKRGTVCGLTQGAARRCKAFLMSIDTSRLDGTAINFTLTLRDCPPSSDEWESLKKQLFRRLRKMGLIRLHFVTEWTKRGLPHLHGMAFFEKHHEVSENLGGGNWFRYLTPINEHMIKWAWIDIASTYGVNLKGQHTRREQNIDTAWFKYMSKHASRSAGHYQRQLAHMPEAWHKTGRMWGKLGQDWPTHSEQHELPSWAFHHLRRQVRRLRRSQALTEAAKARLTGNDIQLSGAVGTLRYLRSIKRRVNPSESSRMPISEWVCQDDAMRLLDGIHLNIEPKPDVDYRRISLGQNAPRIDPNGLGARAMQSVRRPDPV